MIVAHDLRKTFAAKVAVESVSFSAKPGRITGLLGPNGAGKSTSIRMLCGVLQPDQGEVFIDEIALSRQPLAAKSRMGVVGDVRGLYGRLTVRENLRYFGDLRGVPAGTLAERIESLAEMLGLTENLDRRTEGFSTGERVKVAIARALLHDPPNIILDEPSSGLDVLSTRAMREFIGKLRGEGKTVVLTSHIMQEVAMLCDDIAIINRGRIVHQGTQEELIAVAGCTNIEEAFVALIGAENGYGS